MRCPNSSFLSGIIVYVSLLVFVFFVLTQSKSVTDSIKELLSRKEMISSLSFVDVICNKKNGMLIHAINGNMKKKIEHVELTASLNIRSQPIV